MDEYKNYTIAWHLNDKLISFEAKQKFINILIEKGYTTQTILSEIEFMKLWTEYERRYVLI